MVEVETGIPIPVREPVIEPKKQIETYTIKQTMSLLNIGHTTVYKLAAEGEITIIKVFGKSLVVGLRDFVDRKAAEARQLRAAN